MNRMWQRIVGIGLTAVMLTAPLGVAQQQQPDAVSAAAAAAAAASQPARKAVTIPQGFRLTSIAGRSVICESGDVRWIQQTLLTLEPATRPSTMPVDLLKSLESSRGTLIKLMSDDLELNGTTEATVLVDGKLKTLLTQFMDMRVPVYFFATTLEKLTGLVSGGWGTDWFTYNAGTGQLMLKAGITLDAEKPMDDVLLPVVFPDGATQDQKAEILSRVIRSSEANIQSQVSGRAIGVAQLTIADFINDEVIVPLKLQPDQQWFRFGVCSVLSAKYLSRITGMPLSGIIERMTAEPANSPIKMATVDLIHPLNAGDLKEDVVPYYIEAMRRKSTKVVYEWTHGEGAPIGKVLQALRKTPAPDGPAFVQAIKQATGTDLTRQLGAGN